MDTFWYIVLQVVCTVCVLGVLIFVHELGHFIAAKACGVRVTEFALGMGPALWKKQGKETLYALRLFPIGGYCAMTGEDEEIPDDPKAMRSKPVWKRMIIVLAGAFMNLVLGVILVSIVVCARPIPSTVVHSFDENALSSGSGLQADDEIIAVDGTKITGYMDMATRITSKYGENSVDLTVLRDGNEIVLEDVVFPVEKVDEELTYPALDFLVYRERKTPGTIFKSIASETGSYLTIMYTSLRDMVTGRISLKYVSGPIGISSVLADAATTSWLSLLSIAALISINLCVMNLLPLPALDGGRFLCMVIEAIIRKPIPAKIEGVIHGIGLMLLLAIMLIVAFKDIFFPIY